MSSAVTACWKPGSWAELVLSQAPRKLSSTSATILLCDPKQATSSLCGFLPYFLPSLFSLFAARTSPSLECVFSESHLGLCARFSSPLSSACQALVSRLPVSCHRTECTSREGNGCCLPSGTHYCPVNCASREMWSSLTVLWATTLSVDTSAWHSP